MWGKVFICAVIIGSANSVQRANNAPNLGFMDPYEFHQRLTQQIMSQHAAQNRALTSVYASNDENVFAEASNYPDYDEQFQNFLSQQQAFFDNLQRQSQAAAYHGGGIGGGAGNYASASGTFGPEGAYQSAAVYPENPEIPNIENRFSESIPGGNFRGVSVSSYSHSSDIDGKRTSSRGAQTTINDNGKITTYRVNS